MATQGKTHHSSSRTPRSRALVGGKLPIHPNARRRPKLKKAR